MEKARVGPRPKRYALVLAAGKSTRFKSSLPKVIHPLCGKPLICHILDKLLQVGVEKIFVVTGPQSQQIRDCVAHYPVDFVIQEEQLGTGHGVMAAAAQLRSLKGSLLVLYGDTPLIRSGTLSALIEALEKNEADQVILTAEYEDPTGYGRVIRNPAGEAVTIVEEKDVDPDQKKIREVNVGFNSFKISSLLPALKELSRENAAGEYYLTDVFGVLRHQGKKVMTTASDSAFETKGINNRKELAAAEAQLRSEIAQKWMLEGVTILDPGSVRIDETVELSADTVIYPGVFLEGTTKVGSGCTIYGYCHLQNAVIEDGAIIDHCSVIRNSTVGKGTRVGPFAHLREGAVIGARARIGNFVEVKRSGVGDGSKAAHLSYLGDSEIGKDVNIGAGTITCNYDGFQKNKTVIEDGVFVGSDSQLVAPVTVGKDAYIGAGSCITEDVPAEALAIARSRQTNKDGWVREKKGKKTKKTAKKQH